MAALNTEQLECMLKSIVGNGDIVSVLGVFPADRVPLKVLVDSVGDRVLRTCEDDQVLRNNVHYCFILNTHAHDQPGEHWLAFFYNCNTNVLEYFDSFAIPLTMYDRVYDALDVCGLRTLCTPVNTAGMLQSTSSTVCGHYCVVFLYWRAKHCTNSPTRFSAVVAKQGSATQRDKYIVHTLTARLTRAACCTDVLTRGGCSQSCTCCTRI